MPHCMNLASVCHLPHSDTLRLSLQESRRNLNAVLAIVQDWKRRMSAEKFLEAVTALQHGRPCPEGFSLAKSPQEQAFTTKKVMILDRNHPYLPSHARGAQADSRQVAESAPPTASTPPPESPQEQAFTTNQVMILTSNDWHPCLPVKLPKNAEILGCPNSPQNLGNCPKKWAISQIISQI